MLLRSMEGILCAWQYSILIVSSFSFKYDATCILLSTPKFCSNLKF